jgi:hypothetical protein
MSWISRVLTVTHWHKDVEDRSMGGRATCYMLTEEWGGCARWCLYSDGQHLSSHSVVYPIPPVVCCYPHISHPPVPLLHRCCVGNVADDSIIHQHKLQDTSWCSHSCGPHLQRVRKQLMHLFCTVLGLHTAMFAGQFCCCTARVFRRDSPGKAAQWLARSIRESWWVLWSVIRLLS